MEELRSMTTICLLLGVATIFSGIRDLYHMTREEEAAPPKKDNVIRMEKEDFYPRKPQRKAE